MLIGIGGDSLRETSKNVSQPSAELRDPGVEHEARD